MFADNDQRAREAFNEWMNQGPGRPTNGDLVEYDKIDIELLHHLASFMYRAGMTANVAIQGPRSGPAGMEGSTP